MLRVSAINRDLHIPEIIQSVMTKKLFNLCVKAIPHTFTVLYQNKTYNIDEALVESSMGVYETLSIFAHKFRIPSRKHPLTPSIVMEDYHIETTVKFLPIMYFSRKYYLLVMEQKNANQCREALRIVRDLRQVYMIDAAEKDKGYYFVEDTMNALYNNRESSTSGCRREVLNVCDPILPIDYLFWKILQYAVYNRTLQEGIL